MNVKTIVAVALACGLVSLAGCASMGKDKDSRSLVSALSDDPIDEAYVAQVNQEAIKHFAIVLWVNPPDKTKPRSDQN